MGQETAARDIRRSSLDMNYILILVGAVSFLWLVAILFNLDLHLYQDAYLRDLNPQASSGILLYGVELVLGVLVLSLALVGLVLRSLESRVLHFLSLGIILISFGYFAYSFGIYIVGLFFDEFYIGFGLVFMIIGASRNLIMSGNKLKAVQAQ